MSSRKQVPITGAFDRLVNAARDGSNEALGELLDQWRSYLLLVANQELGDDLCAKAGASDLVQDAFTHAQRSFGSFSGNTKADLSGWLRRILLNQIFALRRQFSDSAKRDIRREESLDSDTEARLIAPEDSPVSNVEASEQVDMVHRELDSLPAEYAQVLRLRYWENLSFKEIGDRMNCTSEAARKCWGRAVHKLASRRVPQRLQG